MRQAIVRLALFLALLFVLDRLVYAGAMYLRDHGGAHPDGIDLIYQDQSWNPAVVFFGDSRTRRNFDMQAVEGLTGLKAYDFGIDSASAEESLFMLEQYLTHQHHPRVVVFEADPPLLDAGYGAFHKEHFRDHVAVVPDPADLMREATPTLQQRASALAVTWLMRSASIPNRLPDLWDRWLEPGNEATSEVLFYPCGPSEMHLRCRYYNGAENFVAGNGERMTWQPMQFRIDAKRMALFEHIAWLAQHEDFSLMFIETPRLDGDRAYRPDEKARADAFFCGLAQTHPGVLYARITHVDGIDRDSSFYWDWEHFNALGATKMSQLIAPLITTIASGVRPEPCLLD